MNKKPVPKVSVPPPSNGPNGNKFTVTKRNDPKYRKQKNGKPESTFGGKRGKGVQGRPPEDRRCTEINSNGTRCQRWCSEGEKKCGLHGGAVNETPKPRWGGRSLYDPKYHPALTIRYMKRGYSLIELCSKFGISPMTYKKWVKQYEELNEAWELGLIHAEAYWVNKVKNNLENRAFNERLFSMYMVNRFGWNSGKTQKNIDLQAQVSGVLVSPPQVQTIEDWQNQVEQDPAKLITLDAQIEEIENENENK